MTPNDNTVPDLSPKLSIDDRLEKLGLTLPEAAAPAANYVPYRVSGNTIYVSGQLPIKDGTKQYIGKLGGDISVADGQQAARLCAINILAQVKAALHAIDGGAWTRNVACVKLGGFVNCTPDFADHAQVMNGASDLIAEVLGDNGKHARFAVGAPNLPFNVAVEVDAIFEIR